MRNRTRETHAKPVGGLHSTLLMRLTANPRASFRSPDLCAEGHIVVVCPRGVKVIQREGTCAEIRHTAGRHDRAPPARVSRPPLALVFWHCVRRHTLARITG